MGGTVQIRDGELSLPFLALGPLAVNSFLDEGQRIGRGDSGKARGTCLVSVFTAARYRGLEHHRGQEENRSHQDLPDNPIVYLPYDLPTKQVCT